MLGIWLGLLSAPADAATLEVALKEHTGHLVVPNTLDVSIALKGGPEDKPVEASWETTDGGAIAIVCSDKGATPEDAFVEQPLLTVGEQKWALAPGSSVKFSCPAGKPATVTDLQGQTLATFPGAVVLTVNKAKPRAEH